jgi:hypothetical protein
MRVQGLVAPGNISEERVRRFGTFAAIAKQLHTDTWSGMTHILAGSDRVEDGGANLP